MRVVALYRSPIKSCRLERCNTIEITPHGVVGDREFMLVDAKDPTQFVTQRQEPSLARVAQRLTQNGIMISADGMTPILKERYYWNIGARIRTNVHGRDCVGVDQGNELARWFSDFLHRSVRLLWMANEDARTPSRLPAGVHATFKFADGYPLMLTSESSLLALNRLKNKELPDFDMEQFRPNIVIDGDLSDPWSEEMWNSFLCGSIRMRGVKPCERCVIITTDQRTGKRTPQLLGELLRIHAGERAGKSVPLFGMNLIPETTGFIRRRDLITDIEFGARPEL